MQVTSLNSPSGPRPISQHSLVYRPISPFHLTPSASQTASPPVIGTYKSSEGISTVSDLFPSQSGFLFSVSLLTRLLNGRQVSHLSTWYIDRRHILSPDMEPYLGQEHSVDSGSGQPGN